MRICPACSLPTSERRCPKCGLVTVDQAMLERSDPMIGRVVAGKFRVEERLGGGGWGIVYRAVHEETGGAVAVKLIRSDVGVEHNALRRFVLEAQTIAALQHPNTVRILDFGSDAELLYLVMEHVRGVPLNLLLGQGPLPWPRAVRIARQVLAALSEAHEHPRRIVHRDVKPANIMVCDQPGMPDFVKLLDFGIARALEGEGASTRGALGTPRYMAPEQILSGPVDGRTDLYGLGCVLYRMLAGRPPFEARDRSTDGYLAVAKMQVEEAPPPLAEVVVQQLPVGLVRLVHRLLAKDKKDRPASAREAITELDAAADAAVEREREHAADAADPTLAQLPDAPTITIESDILAFESRDSGPGGAGASPAAPGMGLAAAPRPTLRDDDSTGVSAGPPPRKRGGPVAGFAAAAVLLVGVLVAWRLVAGGGGGGAPGASTPADLGRAGGPADAGAAVAADLGPASRFEAPDALTSGEAPSARGGSDVGVAMAADAGAIVAADPGQASDPGAPARPTAGQASSAGGGSDAGVARAEDTGAVPPAAPPRRRPRRLRRKAKRPARVPKPAAKPPPPTPADKFFPAPPK